MRDVCHLMDSPGLLDKGHHVYMDNHYTHTDLFEELHFRNTFACGTINPICTNLPKAVVKKDMKRNPKGDCIFRWKGAVLCFRWKEKKPVTVLMTIHEAVMVEMGRQGRQKNWKTQSSLLLLWHNGWDRYKWLASKLLHIFMKKSSGQESF